MCGVRCAICDTEPLHHDIQYPTSQISHPLNLRLFVGRLSSSGFALGAVRSAKIAHSGGGVQLRIAGECCRKGSLDRLQAPAPEFEKSREIPHIRLFSVPGLKAGIERIAVHVAVSVGLVRAHIEVE